MHTNTAEKLYDEPVERPKRILIVDDDEDILDSLFDMLSLEGGYEIETAYNALDVENVLTNFTPDLALLDIRLEHTTSFALISEIKEKSPDTICIMMTAYRDIDYAVKAIKAGATDYLFKPLDPELLLSSLDSHLNLHSENAEKNSALRHIQMIFEETSELFFLLNTKGELLEISQTALDFSGQYRSDIINKIFWETPWWSQCKETSELILAAVNTAAAGKYTSLEIEIKSNDNKLSCLDLSFKPMHDEAGTIKFVLVEGHDITERKHIESRLNRLAHYDALTGLPNRILFNEHLSKFIARSDRNESNFALMFIDLDNFKEINDKLGHPAGDQLLSNITDSLKDCIREVDIVSRFGGDEFTLILSEMLSPDSIQIIADRIITAVHNTPFIEGQKTAVGISAGIAIYPQHGDTADELLRNADKAMYEAKRRGKNCWHVYDEIATEKN